MDWINSELMPSLHIHSYLELGFALIMALYFVVIVPTLILFSHFIYRKYGVSTTHFNTKLFDFRDEFKLFTKQSYFKFILGVIIYFLHACMLVWFCIYLVSSLL